MTYPARPPANLPLMIALGIIPLNLGVWFLCVQSRSVGVWMILFSLLAGVQLIAAIWALVATVRHRRLLGRGTLAWRLILGSLAALGAPLGWFMGFLAALYSGGAAWGRPLRIKGRQIHADLMDGDGWCTGERPDAGDLEPTTRKALAALWLHDAQKEHASVPAFARVSWLLVAAGAPAELLAWCQRAALEEIDHARRCFALAAGYGAGVKTVTPMPELLRGGLDGARDAAVILATESISDGCQLEDFNADVAAACARICQDPAARGVLERIAREERSHAAFSWAVLRWSLRTRGPRVHAAARAAAQALPRQARPTAATRDTADLVRLASADQLQAHGRLPDARWADLWERRLAITTTRLGDLLAETGAPIMTPAA